jgi:hypothetical protein
MSDGPIIKPECIPQEAWNQSGPAARACFVMLVERLEKQERLLGMDSGNPSRPPSIGGPGVTPPKNYGEVVEETPRPGRLCETRSAADPYRSVRHCQTL